MSKKRIKYIIYILCTLMAAGLILSVVNRILLVKREDGITETIQFYAQDKNTIDLLVVGSSHAGMNLDAGTFWNERGISSFMLWGSIQPFWNSYYMLKEALKTQQPKVVMLEVFAASSFYDYSDDERKIVNTAGMKPSLNKVQAVMASTPKSKWLSLLFGYPSYHDRYKELGEKDFIYFPWSEGLKNQKGTAVRPESGDITVEDCTDITWSEELHPKSEKYLRKIIEYCQKNDVELVLFATPLANRRDMQPFFNRVAEIADEYGVRFYNLNVMDEQTGYTGDCMWNDGQHLNMKGAHLISSWLACEMDELYDLPDHRGDEKYDSWQINYEEQSREYEEWLNANN